MAWTETHRDKEFIYYVDEKGFNKVSKIEYVLLNEAYDKLTLDKKVQLWNREVICNNAYELMQFAMTKNIIKIDVTNEMKEKSIQMSKKIQPHKQFNTKGKDWINMLGVITLENYIETNHNNNDKIFYIYTSTYMQKQTALPISTLENCDIFAYAIFTNGKIEIHGFISKEELMKCKQENGMIIIETSTLKQLEDILFPYSSALNAGTIPLQTSA